MNKPKVEPKKKPSLSAQLKAEKSSAKMWKNDFFESAARTSEAYRKIAEIESLFPKKYYKIIYKARSQSGHPMTYEKCELSIHPRLFIRDITQKVLDFELISIVTMAE